MGRAQSRIAKTATARFDALVGARRGSRTLTGARDAERLAAVAAHGTPAQRLDAQLPGALHQATMQYPRLVDAYMRASEGQDRAGDEMRELSRALGRWAYREYLDMTEPARERAHRALLNTPAGPRSQQGIDAIVESFAVSLDNQLIVRNGELGESPDFLHHDELVSVYGPAYRTALAQELAAAAVADPAVLDRLMSPERQAALNKLAAGHPGSRAVAQLARDPLFWQDELYAWLELRAQDTSSLAKRLSSASVATHLRDQ